MSYTATCPDPECKTTFEVDEVDLELEVGEEDDGPPLQCPTCQKWWEFDFDADREPALTLTVEADEDEGDEDEDLADGDIEDDEE